MNRTNSVKKKIGITLIELMIVLAIIGILFAIAYPSFTDQIRKTRRAALIVDLMECAAVLERRYTINNTYSTTDCDGLPDNADYAIVVTTPSCTRANGNNTCFLITATPSSLFMQNDTECSSFTYNHLGTKTASNSSNGTSTEKCWRT